jgi:methionyl-tRNA synthetase
VSRVAGLSGNLKLKTKDSKQQFSKEISDFIEEYEFDKALSFVWSNIAKADKLINKREVWNLKGKEKEKILTELADQVRQIGHDLKPFLPETANKIEKQFRGPNIKIKKPLFPRLK